MDIKNCKRCGSDELTWKDRMECEDVMTNELVFRDGVLCLSCKCFHYVKDESFCYEFTITPYVYIDKVKLSEVSDYAVAKSNADDIR